MAESAAERKIDTNNRVEEHTQPNPIRARNSVRNVLKRTKEAPIASRLAAKLKRGDSGATRRLHKPIARSERARDSNEARVRGRERVAREAHRDVQRGGQNEQGASRRGGKSDRGHERRGW